MSSTYAAILETIFLSKYEDRISQVDFTRDDIEAAVELLELPKPKNLGDVIYSARYRAGIPERIQETAPEDRCWIIRGIGPGRYRFALASSSPLTPNKHLSVTKVPNATPGVVEIYALGDEQALLSKVRYNRLIDIFTGITCYSLQNHLRSSVKGIGQVETDELYVGVDTRGCQYVIPVQAKGGKDKLNVVQIEQDMALCQEKYPSLVCYPVAAQFFDDDVIALFLFEESSGETKVVDEKHYRLVEPGELTAEDLAAYRARP